MPKQIYRQPTAVASVTKPKIIKSPHFKEPNEKIAPLGFASSILNGQTTEGGLKSLTYKSVFALKLIGELRSMRKCIVGEDEQLSRVSEKDWANEQTLQKLREDIEQIKQAKDTRNHENDEKISSFNLRLDEELNKNKDVSDEYSDELKRYYAVLNPNTEISYHGVPYRISRNVPVSSVKVDKMEDVPGFDSSIYAQKAEERRVEEEQNRRREQEELELAQNAKEAAMEANAREESLENFSETYVDDLTPDLGNPLDELPPEMAMNLALVPNPDFPTDMNLY